MYCLYLLENPRGPVLMTIPGGCAVALLPDVPMVEKLKAPRPLFASGVAIPAEKLGSAEYPMTVSLPDVTQFIYIARPDQFDEIHDHPKEFPYEKYLMPIPGINDPSFHR